LETVYEEEPDLIYDERRSAFVDDNGKTTKMFLQWENENKILAKKFLLN